MQKGTLVNSTSDTIKKSRLSLSERTDREADLVAFYDIRLGNGAGHYSFNPGARTGRHTVPKYTINPHIILGTCESAISVRIESRIESGGSRLHVQCRLSCGSCVFNHV